jgi:hypothetical protein
MAQICRTMKLLAVLTALVGGGLALWRRRDAVKRAWDSAGGVEGIKESADQLMRSVGPVKDLVTQVAHLK